MRNKRRRKANGEKDSQKECTKDNTLISVRNPYSPIKVLKEEQLQDIHKASMRMAKDFGLEVMSKRVLNALKKAGVRVNFDTMMVQFDEDFIMENIKSAPQQFTITPYNDANKIHIGGNHINFGLVSGTPNVHDNVAKRRRGNMEDYITLIKLYQSFPHLHLIGNQVLPPQELPSNNRHLDTYLATLLHTDKLFSSLSIGRTRVHDMIEMIAIARGETLDDMIEKPGTMTNINVNSPLKLDDMMIEGALGMAEYKQATIVTPFTLMGAMTPVTMAAALAQQNAEALMTIAMIEYMYPGAPVVYGGFTSNVDMRSGSPCFGTPENSLANMAGGQLARFYKLPYRTSACNASNAVDAQAIYETQMSMWGAFMGHGNIIYHAAGWLEGGLVASFEKLMIDQDMITAFIKLTEHINTNEDAFGFDAFEEVGPGGHFFGCAHTMQRYRSAFWESSISDWQNSENWEKAGAKTATQRAEKLWQDILQQYQKPSTLSSEKSEKLEEFVQKRKEEIGSKELL